MAETITVNCQDLITKRVQPRPLNLTGHDQRIGVFVHSLIFSKFFKAAQNQGYEIYEPVWDYHIHIGNLEYPMKLLWLKCGSHIQKLTKYDLILNSRFSYPWDDDDRVCIHTSRNKFHLVEKFLHKTGYGSCVRVQYSDLSLTFAPHEIIVIEFDRTVAASKNLLTQYEKFMDANGFTYPINFYVTFCFGYMKPGFMQYYDKLFDNPDVITQVLLLLDYHRQASRRDNEIFNICDLISMKMAIDDNRFDYENCEFHKVLHKTFREMADRNEYIESKCFNLAEYRTNKGIVFVPEEFLEYLMYNFWSHFSSVALYWTTKINIKLSKINVNKLITMLHHYAHLYIDGTHIDENSSKILLKIITNFKQSNVFLHFDTNYPWRYDQDDYSFTTRYIKSCKLMLVGRNTYHFIENFINWIKITLGSKTKVIDLVIGGAEYLRPYILRGFRIRHLTIHDIDLDFRIINALAHTNFESIAIKQCRLGVDPKNFKALELLHNVQEVAINFLHHIGTVLEILEARLTIDKIKRLRFKISSILFDGNNMDRYIDLDKFDFYLDDQSTQIVNYDWQHNREVYLYDYLYDQSVFDSRDAYEFYT